MRLGLIGGSDSKYKSGIFSLKDSAELQDAKRFVTRFGYDSVFNALASSGVEEGFDVSRDGRYVYVAVRGTRTTATIFQYECTTPWNLSTIVYSNKSLVVGDWELNVNGVAINDDGTKLYFIGYNGDTIWSATLSTPYDLATATVDVKRAYVGTQNATPRTVYVGNGGQNMYVLGTTTTFAVYQYTLGTAWNASTATYANKSLVVSGLDTGPTGLFFGNNGTKLYILGNTNDIVYSYTLSTAWDIATATQDYATKSYVTTQVAVNNGHAVFIGDNGTKMYVLADTATTDTIYQYTLGTAWTVTTATYASKSFNVNAQDTAPTGIFFKSDGTKLYVIGLTNDTIYQYSLSVAWDISTATYDTVSFSVAAQETVPTGLFIDSTGTRLYVIGQTGDDVNQYTLGTPWAINTASFVRVSAAIGEATPNDVHFKSDGTKMYVVGHTTNTIREFNLTTAWDVSTIVFVRVYDTGWLGGTISASGIFFKDDGTELYFYSYTSRTVFQWSLAVPWVSYSVNGRYRVSTEEATPIAMYIRPDGLKMYVTGQTGADVNEYDLSTAWDIATAEFVRVSAAVGEATPTGLWFKDDGTKMYITGSTNDTVREFTLSTAWNVSTIAFSKSLSVGFEVLPSGVAFKDDGTELYVVGTTSDCVYGIPLGTAWDIGTATGFIYIGAVETIPRSLHIDSTGTRLYLAGTGNIRQYVLSTPNQLLGSTALAASFAVSGVYGCHVNREGTRIYVTVDSSSTVSPSGTGRMVRVINLTTPHNLATASLSTAEWIPFYGLTGASAAPWGVRVSADETRMFVLSDAVQGLYQFSLRFA